MSMQKQVKKMKIKLSGFNNLTKILSFNLYDFCVAMNETEKEEYAQYINNRYSSENIARISTEICRIIDANILSVSKQDYTPVGASTLVLMSDVSMHLDKSHITAHTYPDTLDPHGICTFRVDIDIATCGEIIPLKAINYLFESFECDIVVIDYVVRGYTRLCDGKKIYNDHSFDSIQNFISPDILKKYLYRSDINMPHDNIWQTKLLASGPFDIENYFLHPLEHYSPEDVEHKMALLKEEMREVYHLIH